MHLFQTTYTLGLYYNYIYSIIVFDHNDDDGGSSVIVMTPSALFTYRNCTYVAFSNETNNIMYNICCIQQCD